MSTWIAVAAVGAVLAFAVHRVRKEIRMAKQETIDALTAQVQKAKDEIVAAGTPEALDLSGLAAAIQEIDDINPDAEVPPVDEAPTPE